MNNRKSSDYKEFLENEISDRNKSLSTQKNTLNSEYNLLDLSALDSFWKEDFELSEEFVKQHKVNNAYYQKHVKNMHFGVSNHLRKISKSKVAKLHEKKIKIKRQLIYDFFKSNIRKRIFFIYFLLNYIPINIYIKIPYRLNFLKNLNLPNYNIFSNKYNLLSDLSKDYMNKLLKKLSFFHENEGNSFSPKLFDFLHGQYKGYKSSPFVDDIFTNSCLFKIIINDIWEIFCIYSSEFFIKIFCFGFFPAKSNCFEYRNYLNIEIMLNNCKEKIYAKICKIEFDLKYIKKIKKAIDIYELIKGIEINKINIILIKEKEFYFDIFLFLKIIKFPIYKQIKTVKIIIFEPEQFGLMDEYSNSMGDLYGNKTPFYGEIDSFSKTYFCLSKKETE